MIAERDKEVNEKSLTQNKIYNGITFATNGSSEAWNIKGNDVEKALDAGLGSKMYCKICNNTLYFLVIKTKESV